MRTGTKLFLLLGCACVIALEAPRTLTDLSAGWRGPYVRTLLPILLPTDELGSELGVTGASFARDVEGPRHEPQHLEVPVPRPRGRLELARR